MPQRDAVVIWMNLIVQEAQQVLQFIYVDFKTSLYPTCYKDVLPSAGCTVSLLKLLNMWILQVLSSPRGFLQQGPSKNQDQYVVRPLVNQPFSCKSSEYVQPIPKTLQSWGAPPAQKFSFFFFVPHFNWTIQVCMKHSTPVPKSYLFCFWDWKDGTSTIAILLQSYCQSMSLGCCCLHPQAIVEPVWRDGRLPQPVHPAVQAVWRNYFLKNLVRGCPPRPQHLWDWLYVACLRSTPTKALQCPNPPLCNWLRGVPNVGPQKNWNFLGGDHLTAVWSGLKPSQSHQNF
jgi:hypothetical protein